MVQTGFGWNDAGLDEVSWTLVKLAAAGAIAASVVLRRGDLAFGLVAAWASYGMAVKQAATPAVAGTAATVAMISLLLVATEGYRKLRA